MKLPMVVVGMYARGTGNTAILCSHVLLPGVNSQIVLTAAAGLIVNPPRIYSLLLNTENPPGKVVPPNAPGQGAATVVRVSVTGSYRNTRSVEVVAPAAELPTQYM